MRWLAPGRKTVGIAAASLLTISLGATAGVFVAGPAAAPPPKTTTTTATTAPLTPGSDPNSPAAHYFVINGTANAASDHERLGSSAFPNYSTGAVDNYYSLARAHVDNAPFAQGTASPADTGPIGQTAAAGNFQQPQYADARWPGSGSGKATYGTQGHPYAAAEAGEYNATAEASAASSGLSAPSGSNEMATPTGFDGRLQKALATWKAKWNGRLHPKTPTGAVKTPTVKTPTVTVTTPAGAVTPPTVTVGGLTVTPPVSVPTPAIPPAAAPRNATPSRSTSSASTASGDGASLLESSTSSTLDPKTHALVTSGESRLGRVSLGGGQIVLRGIHVSATITNDGTATNKVTVAVGAASIGGVPVTIDQDGVHVSGQGAGLPYQQASDALNTALKQAGIQLFVVTPEITTNSCDQSGTGSGTTTTGTTTTNSTTTSNNQPPPLTTTTTTTNSCDQGSTTTTCDQAGTGTTTTTNATPLPSPTPTTTSRTTTTTATTTQSSPTTTTSSCGDTGTTTTTSSCEPTSTTTGTTTTSSTPTGTTTTTSSGDPAGTPTDTTSPGEVTVSATGVHLLFTQPVSQPGVPEQYAEHILGEVSLDSLAVPAGPPPKLDLSFSSSSSSSSSSCLNGGKSSGKTTGGASAAGGSSSAGGNSTVGGSSSAAGSAPSGSLSSSGSTLGATSQPVSGSTGNSLPAAFASALRKPLWLLLAYVLWQALVIGTGASLWNWRRDGAS
jgi:hypothetical protein